MTEIFGTEMLTWMGVIVVAYFTLVLSPLWFPGILAYRRKMFPRPWLFIGLVASITYGFITFLFFVVAIPAEVYSIFIAPQLEAAGKPFGRLFIIGVQFMESYGWLFAVIAQLIFTVITTVWLSRKWENICVALAD